MNYSEWLGKVPSEITNDPIWNLEVYRLALFSSDIGWLDVNAIYKNDLMQRLANQLYGSLHRMGLHTKLISMLVPMIPHQRAHSIREEQEQYLAYQSSFNLDMEIPFP